MSLRYKFLGKPQNIGEFVDKVTKSGKTNVNLVLGHHDQKKLAGLPDFYAYVEAECENIWVPVTKYVHHRLGNLEDTVLRKTEVEYRALCDAIQTAEKLEGLGLVVTINEQPIDETRKYVPQYELALKGTGIVPAKNAPPPR